MERIVSPGQIQEILNENRVADGDVLVLQGGAEYPAFTLRGLKGVTITARDGRAVILGGSGHGVVLDACRDIAAENLCFRGAGRKYHSRQGVGLLIEGGENITVRNCEASGFQRGGFEARGVSHLLLEDLSACDNGFSGIHVTGDKDKGWSADVTIRRCSARNNPGDPMVRGSHSGNGIVLYYTAGALVELCEASFNGWDMENSAFNGPVGIWCANTQRAVFRHCLSHDNRTQWGKTDGGGFDFDGGTRDSLIESCYSYNNAGAGYMFCQYVNAPELSGNVIRNCASFDDGTAFHKSSLYLFDCGSDSLAEGGLFHHNLLYNSHSRDTVRGHIDSTHIHHNLLLLSGEGQFFRHEYDDSGLRHRGPDRQAWGEVRFEHNRMLRIDAPDANPDIKKLADYPRFQSAQELPGYFDSLRLEEYLRA